MPFWYSTAPHERLEGARTAKAAEYPKAMCMELARVTEQVAKIRQSTVPENAPAYL